MTPKKAEVQFKKYKVKTKDGRTLTLSIRREQYKAFHDADAYVPSRTFYRLDAVDGKKWKGKGCEARVTASKIVLLDGKRVQHLIRLDATAAAKQVEKEAEKLAAMTDDERIEDYLRSIGRSE